MPGFVFARWLLLGWAMLLAVGAQAAAYSINPGDLLRIDIWNEDTLSRDVLVRPDGVISLPMAGEIDTLNASPAQVADRVSSALEKFMKDKPRVVVSLINVEGYKIYVLGKVARPGQYLINSDTDVMQALALAGGLNSFAAEDDIRILRRAEGGAQRAIRFNYARVKTGEELPSNILLRSRDVVVVP